MAQVSKAGPGDDQGAAPPAPGGASASAPQAPQPPRHNLPMKTAPVVGRRREMQAIAEAFEKSRRDGRAGRVEVVGRPGIGATTVAVELARRAGARFAGGAWFLDLATGGDLAWADVAAARGRGLVKNLAATVRDEKERFAGGPQTILILDNARSGEEMLAALPLESRTPPFVFVVCEQKTGMTDDVVEVSDVPPQGARRICQAMLQGAPAEMQPPAVRSIDGLGLTASLAARTAMALQGRAGPLLIENAESAAMRLVPLVAQNATCLELLLLASVMHPSRIAVDALFSAVAEVRRERGKPPTPEEIGQSVLVLARTGLLDPVDDRRVNMHPLVQEIVRSMAKSDEDLRVARESVAGGLVEEAAHAVTPEGVHVATCGLHQLRHMEPQLSGELQMRVKSAREKLESALGIVA
jgi:hypothetical protein